MNGTGRVNQVDRYLVQFRDPGKDYFITDCAFRDGQWDKARFYAAWVLESCDVAEARILDTWQNQESQ